MRYIASSYTYDVELPVNITSVPFATEINISQAIEPNSVDRFQFRMGTSEMGLDSIFYQVEIEILYNAREGNRIKTDKIIIAIKEQGDWGGFTITGINDPEYVTCMIQYYENAIYMLSLPGIRSEELSNEKSVFIEQQKEFLEAIKK